MVEQLEKSIHQYLQDPGNGSTDSVRVTSRRFIRQHVGPNTYLGRVPAVHDDPYAMIIRRVDTEHYPDVPGEPECAQALVEITALTKDSPLLCQEIVAEHVRKALENYSGDIGGDGHIYGCTIQGDSMRQPTFPSDAREGWKFGYSLILEITYKQS